MQQFIRRLLRHFSATASVCALLASVIFSNSAIAQGAPRSIDCQNKPSYGDFDPYCLTPIDGHAKPICDANSVADLQASVREMGTWIVESDNELIDKITIYAACEDIITDVGPLISTTGSGYYYRQGPWGRKATVHVRMHVAWSTGSYGDLVGYYKYLEKTQTDVQKVGYWYVMAYSYTAGSFPLYLYDEDTFRFKRQAADKNRLWLDSPFHPNSRRVNVSFKRQ